MTASTALVALRAAVQPFLDQDYHAESKTLSPGLSMRDWLDLEEAAGLATEIIDRADASAALGATFRADHALKP